MEYLNSGQFLSVLYHDIFDFPLTWNELVKWEARSLGSGRFTLKKSGKFYHLSGRRDIVLKRLVKEKASITKIEIAKKAASKIAQVPSVLMLGITGALAMGNARQEDDIDLLIVTRRGALWATRLMVVALIDLLGIPRRKPQSPKVANRLCLNIWLDEENLTVHPKQRNTYTAHEVLQVVPLVNKEGTYEKFIWANSWTREFWPKAVNVEHRRQNTEDRNSLIFKLLNSLITHTVETPARSFQFWYMRERKTREVVEPGRAFFHPIDWQKFVLLAFQKRIEDYLGPNHFFFARKFSNIRA